jgi:hypothetical protein
LLFEFFPHIPQVSQEQPQEHELFPFFLLIMPFTTTAANIAAIIAVIITVGHI